MPIMTGLSGNEMYCLSLKGLAPGELLVGNSVRSMGFLGVLGAGLQGVFGGEVSRSRKSSMRGGARRLRGWKRRRSGTARTASPA